MNKKKVLSILLAFVILATNCFFAFAEDDNEKNGWKIKVDKETGKQYILDVNSGAKIYEAYKYDENGNLVLMDLSEYYEILISSIALENDKDKEVSEETSETDTVTASSPITYTESRFEKLGTRQTTGHPIKVTPDVIGPAGISYANSQSVSESFSIASGVSYDITKKIRANAGFTWNTSASTNTSFGVTFTVPDGEKGYVQFTPYLNMVYGDSYMDTKNTAGIVIDTTYCGMSYGYSPKILSNCVLQAQNA